MIGADSGDGFERGFAAFLQDHGDISLVVDVRRRPERGGDVPEKRALEQPDIDHVKPPDGGSILRRHGRGELDADLGCGASIRWHQDVLDHVSSIPFVDGTP